MSALAACHCPSCVRAVAHIPMLQISLGNPYSPPVIRSGDMKIVVPTKLSRAPFIPSKVEVKPKSLSLQPEKDDNKGTEQTNKR